VAKQGPRLLVGNDERLAQRRVLARYDHSSAPSRQPYAMPRPSTVRKKPISA
jgi:hypothetical protein